MDKKCYVTFKIEEWDGYELMLKEPLYVDTIDIYAICNICVDFLKRMNFKDEQIIKGMNKSLSEI